MRIPRTFTDFPSAYSSFEDVPEERKLHTYRDQFAGVDVWVDYLIEQYPEGISDELHGELVRVERDWKSTCREYDVHHALPTPFLFNNWCSSLLDRMQMSSAKNNYLSNINRFFRFLMWNIDYPHCYNPFQFAVEEYELVAEVWSSEPW